MQDNVVGDDSRPAFLKAHFVEHLEGVTIAAIAGEGGDKGGVGEGIRDGAGGFESGEEGGSGVGEGGAAEEGDSSGEDRGWENTGVAMGFTSPGEDGEGEVGFLVEF